MMFERQIQHGSLLVLLLVGSAAISNSDTLNVNPVLAYGLVVALVVPWANFV
jgi:hypothetical protein